jgi:hypothetical protein
VRPTLALAGCTALVLASGASAEGARVDRPRVALSVSPARLALAVPGSRTIKLRNDGADRVVIDATRRTVGRETTAKTWLQIVPRRVVLRPSESATVTLRASPPPRAEPGDHHVLVLLTTRPPSGGRVNVQLRLGVRLRMVVPGRIVRRLIVGDLHVRRRRATRFIFVSVVNRGNVTVRLRGRVTAVLVRRGRQVGRLSPVTQRALLPGTRALIALRYAGPVRGPVTAVVQIRLGPGIRLVERRHRIRL